MSNTASTGSWTDRNLLFGVLALQADLLNAACFAEACSAWVAGAHIPFADFLVEGGWLNAEERTRVDLLLDRKLQDQKGGAGARSAEGTSGSAQPTIALRDDSLVSARAGSPVPAKGIRERVTVDYEPAGRERYTLTRLHAKGGLGQVWVARDGDLGREVALKELRGSRVNDPALLARFLEEARITGQLEHPNIVPVYELVRLTEAGSEPFYTMRFVRGRTLTEAIGHYHDRRMAKQAGSLELRELLQCLIAVCNAVAYAHSRGVLHRDLKPDNVVLGDYGEVILLDWGLAKIKGGGEAPAGAAPMALGQDLVRMATVQGQIMGTPAYMSPEQAEGRLDSVDERSDIYELGAVLYEILTGQPPFGGSDAAAVLARVVADQPPDPANKVQETPAALQAVCLKALAKRPDDRYPTAKEFGRELERWLGDEPVTAYREPTTERARRWVRRHRLLVAATAALVVASLPLLVVIAVNREQARREAQQAKRDILDQKRVADDNERTANEREAQIRAAMTFLEKKVFAAARPRSRDGGLGPEVTLLEAVEATLPAVRETFGQQPLSEAQVRMTLGQSFWYSGKWRLAVEQFEIAHSIYEKHLGSDDQTTLWSARNLGNSYADSGRYADAAKLEEKTLAITKTSFGPDHAATLIAINNLARSCNVLGRYADAARLGEEAVTRYKAAQGIDGVDTLRSMYNLANSYAGLGRQDEALKLRQETLERRRAKFGSDHPDTLASMNSLALSYDALGRHAQARDIFEKTVTAHRAVLGAEHPETVRSMNNLAVTYAHLGRLTDALDLFEKTVALLKRTLGADHPDTLDTMYNIACIHAMIAPNAPNRARETDLAMECLKQAVAAGFTNVGQIKNDPDLSSLRDRDDFRKLIATMEAAAATEKK
jgi:tetratricopeptide (TPR) repeat protein/tRNA A-37 threonylcarbamoyl transferase component Bud32